jgi:vacuolar-type H+-ATPase subunit I/STV1
MATIGIATLIIAVSHFKIDVIKSYCSQNTTAFIIDQLAHVAVILGVFLYATNQWHNALALIKLLGAQHLAVLLAYLAVLKPSSIIIKQLLSPWSSEVLTNKPPSSHPNDPPTITTEALQTLSLAGQRIGYLERVLMLTFVLLNQFSAIGFLIAAKSIFRFGDLTKHQDRKLTEYVLLGTFTSVAITFAIGLACAAALGQLPVKS